MPYDLDRFTLEDTYFLAAELRRTGESAAQSNQAARALTSYLFEQLRAAESGASACPLVRLFRTISWSALSEDTRATLQATLDRAPDPNMLFLALQASRG